jgi:LPXTG-motif cell wall-anchored protein
MNYKQAITVVILFIGLVLTTEAGWKMYRIDDIKDDVTEIISPFTDEKAQEDINQILERSYGYNERRIYITLAIGIVLILTGSGLLYFFRKRK